MNVEPGRAPRSAVLDVVVLVVGMGVASLFVAFTHADDELDDAPLKPAVR